LHALYGTSKIGEFETEATRRSRAFQIQRSDHNNETVIVIIIIIITTTIIISVILFFLSNHAAIRVRYIIASVHI